MSILLVLVVWAWRELQKCYYAKVIRVSGSDLSENALTQWLRVMGADYLSWP